MRILNAMVLCLCLTQTTMPRASAAEATYDRAQFLAHIEKLGGKVSTWSTGGIISVTLNGITREDFLLDSINWPPDNFVLILEKAPITDGLAHSLERRAKPLSLVIHDIKIDNQGLARILDSVQVRSLTISNTGMPASIADAISESKDLVYLSLNDEEIDDRFVRKFCAGRSKLRSLLIQSKCSVRGDSVAEIGKLSELTQLTINCPAQLGQANIRGWASLKHLNHLNLDNSNVVDEALPMLCSLKEIKKVSLCNTKVTGAGVNSLECLSDMTLQLSKSMIQHDSLKLGDFQKRGVDIDWME